MAAPKLLPCPFCGDEAEYSITSDEGQRNDFDTVRCKTCVAEMRTILHWMDKGGEHRDALASAWNRRAAIAQHDDRKGAK